MNYRRSQSCRLTIEEDPRVVILGYPDSGDIKIQVEESRTTEESGESRQRSRGGFIWPSVFINAFEGAKRGKNVFTSGPVTIRTEVQVPYLTMHVTISPRDRDEIKITLNPYTIDEIIRRLNTMRLIVDDYEHGGEEETDDRDEQPRVLTNGAGHIEAHA